MKRPPRLSRLTDGMKISALSNERGQYKAAWQLVLPRTTLWRHCTTHLVMSPLEFLRRLPALALRPRRRGMVARCLKHTKPGFSTGMAVVSAGLRPYTGRHPVPAGAAGRWLARWAPEGPVRMTGAASSGPAPRCAAASRPGEASVRVQVAAAHSQPPGRQRQHAQQPEQDACTLCTGCKSPECFGGVQHKGETRPEAARLLSPATGPGANLARHSAGLGLSP